jgi:hypothetical protein
MTGKEMIFDSSQKPIKGAGYIQALPGKYIMILVLVECEFPAPRGIKYIQLAISVNRVDWDDEGKTTNIQRINPIIGTSLGGKFKILSDLDKPKLTNGILHISLGNMGDYSFQILFGDKGTLKSGDCRKLHPR